MIIKKIEDNSTFNVRNQLQTGIEKLTGLIKLLQTYPNHKFRVHNDVSYLMMRGEMPIIRNLVKNNIVRVSCQEKTN